MSREFAASDVAPLQTDEASLHKKRDVTLQKCARLTQTVHAALQALVDESALEQRQWVSAAAEKLAWCAQPANDKYSVEAKLETLQQLQESVEQGWQLTEVLNERLESLRSIEPVARHQDITDRKKEAGHAVTSLVKQLAATKYGTEYYLTQDMPIVIHLMSFFCRVKLEANLQQLEGYDELYSSLSAWLKSTEANIRTEAALKADLPQKEKQQAAFKMIGTDVAAHRQGVDSVLTQARDISESNADTRVLSYAQNLQKRYDAVVTSVAEHLQKAETSVEAHRSFNQLRAQACEWMSAAEVELEGNREADGDSSSVVGDKLRCVTVGQLKQSFYRFHI